MARRCQNQYCPGGYWREAHLLVWLVERLHSRCVCLTSSSTPSLLYQREKVFSSAVHHISLIIEHVKMKQIVSKQPRKWMTQTHKSPSCSIHIFLLQEGDSAPFFVMAPFACPFLELIPLPPFSELPSLLFAFSPFDFRRDPCCAIFFQ